MTRKARPLPILCLIVSKQKTLGNFLDFKILFILYILFNWFSFKEAQ
jgi:hypothetical protein